LVRDPKTSRMEMDSLALKNTKSSRSQRIKKMGERMKERVLEKSKSQKLATKRTTTMARR
jgi:hypothetical protein